MPKRTQSFMPSEAVPSPGRFRRSAERHLCRGAGLTSRKTAGELNASEGSGVTPARLTRSDLHFMTWLRPSASVLRQAPRGHSQWPAELDELSEKTDADGRSHCRCYIERHPTSEEGSS
ncbi:hypothetical protein SKAU_G00183770 [Synaphobranchus kaupii]|uniref:Uncharacterized protein n=1 Tax=Synaphobranchus kaupii TaxID=118154 RepID=A0A9Q1IWI9_SYNKA|nr:hypothetical protein SKAU_G00183770 [Synaphobranchus kaupii]